MRAKLSLISDEFGRAGRLGPVHVVVAPEDAPPFPVDAIAVEEDTHLLLSSDGVVEEPDEDFDELIAAAGEPPANTPGSVLVRKGQMARQVSLGLEENIHQAHAAFCHGHQGPTIFGIHAAGKGRMQRQ